jgi:hypothetical protein
MNPQVSLAGRVIQFDWMKYFGGSGFFSKYWSGVDGVSGITMTNVNQGQFNVQLNSSDTSGFDSANYYYQIRLTDGIPLKITEGHILLSP